MVLCAGLFGLGLLADQANWKVTWFTLAFGALGLSEAPFWATAVDIGGRAGGTANTPKMLMLRSGRRNSIHFWGGRFPWFLLEKIG